MNIRQFMLVLVSTVAVVAAGAPRAEDPAPPAASPAATPSAAPAPEMPAPPAAAEAPTPAVPAVAPAAPATAPVAAAPSDTATVIFFRPSKFVGGAVGFIVREGQTELGKLRNGKYFVLHVSPGKHEYVVHSEAKDVLTIDADPGETYYIQGSITMGLMVGRPNLSPSDQATFEAVKAKLKEVPPMSDKD